MLAAARSCGGYFFGKGKSLPGISTDVCEVAAESLKPNPADIGDRLKIINSRGCRFTLDAPPPEIGMQRHTQIIDRSYI